MISLVSGKNYLDSNSVIMDMDSDSSTFEQHYRCYFVSFIEKAHLEKGDKVIMPASALHRLAYLNIEYPMLFELRNATAGRIFYYGVLEFCCR